MKVFVTGGTGFVGSHLVRALLAAGHQVSCLVRNPAKGERVFGTERPGVVRGDLDDDAALRQGAATADAIYHVAALTAATSREAMFRVNEGATRRLIAAARAAPGARFVYISSLAAVGPSVPGAPHHGDHAPNPVTDYGASKLAGERAVRDADLPWTILRPPTVYGPRDTELLRMFQMTRRGFAPVFGTGSQELSLVFAEDLARALVAVLDTPPGGIYYAAYPEILTSRELVAAIHRAVRPASERGPLVLPVPGPLARGALWMTGLAARLANRATLLSSDKANEFLAPAWTCRADALERDTGWTATHDSARGLSETAAWYREHGWL